jgi:phage recombination protein Bet
MSNNPNHLPERHTATALAIRPDQSYWDEQQLAALAQLGLQRAPRGDLAVFFHQCQRTGLDPFARQIYMIGRGGRYGIQTAIDGFRVIADRACIERGWVRSEEPTVWFDKAGQAFTEWVSDTPPVAARYTVVVITPNGAGQFAGFARFEEYNAGTNLWKKMPALMVAKCAEALALRKAFPQDLSGLYTDEEMAQADVQQPSRPQVRLDGVAAKDVKNRAFQALTEAGIDRDDAIAAVAAAWDATDHADADRITDAQAEEFLTAVQAVIDADDAEVVEEPGLPADERDPFAIDAEEVAA